MNLLGFRTIFRNEMFDVATPPLWVDTECNEFANDALMEAVRRGFTIVDSDTAAICQIPYTTNPVVSLDPRVIVIRSAILAGQVVPLQRMKSEMMDILYPGWRDTTGKYPTIYIDDWDSAKIRLYPAPTTAGTVNLQVSREPLAPMVADGDIPELPARYHRSLVYWMKYRAYSKDDTEGTNLPFADKAEMEFSREFGERKSARNEKWSAEQAGQMSDTLA